MPKTDWDIRFLRLAREVSTWSKDPSTQTGAVIVRPNKSVASMGFNGFPQSMPDLAAHYENREEKYSRIVHCTVPKHRTLTADLRWVELGQLSIGDELIGFDEFPVSYSGRKYRRSIVEQIVFAKEPVFRVVFNDSSEILATAEHRWLLGIRSNNVRRWRRTDELEVAPKNTKLTSDGLPHRSSKIYKLFAPWMPATDHDAGYLAGILDGEGSISRHGHTLQFAQRPGVVLDKALEILKSREQDLHVWPHSCPMTGGLGKKDCLAAHIRGPLVDRLAFLGTIRPERLISKLNPDKFGRVHSHPDRIRAVMTVEPAGVQEIVKVQTSTRTMIVEGFPMHNCEMNALLFAKEPVAGYTLYTWPFASCDRCAVNMLQAGIVRFVYPELPADKKDRWQTSLERTLRYFRECRVATREVSTTELHLMCLDSVID